MTPFLFHIIFCSYSAEFTTINYINKLREKVFTDYLCFKMKESLKKTSSYLSVVVFCD
jgi:hypothetical protein